MTLQLFLPKTWKLLADLHGPLLTDCKWTPSRGCLLGVWYLPDCCPLSMALWAGWKFELAGNTSFIKIQKLKEIKMCAFSCFVASFLVCGVSRVMKWSRWRALSYVYPWEKIELCLWKRLLGYPPLDHTHVGEEISAWSANFIHVLLTCPFTFPQAKDDFFIEGCFSLVIRAQNKAAVYTNFFRTVRII